VNKTAIAGRGIAHVYFFDVRDAAGIYLFLLKNFVTTQPAPAPPAINVPCGEQVGKLPAQKSGCDSQTAQQRAQARKKELRGAAESSNLLSLWLPWVITQRLISLRYNLISGSLWAVGGIAGLPGLIRLNMLGSNPVVLALGFIPIIEFGLLVLANFLQMAGVFNTDSNTPAGVGWLVEMAGKVLVGILAIAAKVWDGWKCFVPLLAVVLAPLGFALGSLVGDLNLGIMPLYAVWILLGSLAATSEPVQGRQNLAAA
jgi:hypothetical protein